MKRLVLNAALWLFACNAVHGASLDWELGSHQESIVRALDLLSDADKGGDQPVYLLRAVEAKFSDSGLFERVAEVTYFPSAESVQDWRSYIYWDSSRQSILVREAVTISPDGNRILFDPGTVQVLDTNTYDVFTDTKEIVLHLPGLGAGVIAVVVFDRSTADPHATSTRFVGGSYPVRQFRYSATWPEGFKPAFAPGSDAGMCKRVPQGLVCTADNLPPLRGAGEGLLRDFVPRIGVAPAQSWDDIVSYSTGLVDQALEGSRTIPALAARLREQDNPLAGAHRLVSREIRYVSFSEGSHSHTPHDPDVTLSNRYGDCKDKAALFIALMRELGHEAYAVLVATERLDPTLLDPPNLGYFDHMVACAAVAGKERCFDLTDAYTGFGDTPQSLHGRVRLKLEPGATPDAFPVPRYTWQADISAKLVFQADGAQTEDLTRVYPGAYAAFMRSWLWSLSPEERVSQLTTNYDSVINGRGELETSVNNLDNINAPLEIASTTRFAGMAPTAPTLTYSDAAFWTKDLATSFKSDNKHLPYQFAGVRTSSELTFDMNQLWKVSATGSEVAFDTRFGKFHRSYSTTGGNVIVKTRMELPSATISIAELPKFNQFLDLIAGQTGLQFWADGAAN